jgi:hypothetical protein
MHYAESTLTISGELAVTKSPVNITNKGLFCPKRMIYVLLSW